MFRRTYAVIAYVIGLAGAGLFFAYVLGQGVGVWPRDEATSVARSMIVNLALLVLFALQHSGMARSAFKYYFLRYFTECIERSTYVAASGLVLAALSLLWQPLPGAPIWHGPIAIVLLSLGAAANVGVCAAWFDHATFFGLTQGWTGVVPAAGKLRIEGPYRIVRHPLMLGLLVAIWVVPIMVPELLMLNLGMTAYILIAIRLEERDLVRVFGVDYEAYQRTVPAIVPFSK